MDKPDTETQHHDLTPTDTVRLQDVSPTLKALNKQGAVTKLTAILIPSYKRYKKGRGLDRSLVRNMNLLMDETI